MILIPELDSYLTFCTGGTRCPPGGQGREEEGAVHPASLRGQSQGEPDRRGQCHEKSHGQEQKEDWGR